MTVVSKGNDGGYVGTVAIQHTSKTRHVTSVY
jgi:hypothetical protein